MRDLLPLLRQSVRSWQADKAPQLAASSAYYTVFSLAPLLLVLLGVLGLVWERGVAEERVLAELQGLVGRQGADAVGSMLEAASRSRQSGLATAIGIGTLLVGATGLLTALQDAVNSIWNVEVRPGRGGVMRTLLRRVFSFGMLLSIGFLLMVSLAASAAVTAITDSLGERLPAVAVGLPAINASLSFAVLLVLFALLFKYLPDVVLRWRDVWVPAAFTSLLFTLGKSLLGWYLGQKDFVSAYGVAGSLIVLLLWVNYSAQIFFLGVEMTKERARMRGRDVRPKDYAAFVGKSRDKEEPSTVIPDLATIAGFLVLEYKAWRWYASAKRAWRALRRSS